MKKVFGKVKSDDFIEMKMGMSRETLKCLAGLQEHYIVRKKRFVLVRAVLQEMRSLFRLFA